MSEIKSSLRKNIAHAVKNNIFFIAGSVCLVVAWWCQGKADDMKREIDLMEESYMLYLFNKTNAVSFEIFETNLRLNREEFEKIDSAAVFTQRELNEYMASIEAYLNMNRFFDRGKFNTDSTMEYGDINHNMIHKYLDQLEKIEFLKASHRTDSIFIMDTIKYQLAGLSYKAKLIRERVAHDYKNREVWVKNQFEFKSEKEDDYNGGSRGYFIFGTVLINLHLLKEFLNKKYGMRFW